MPTTPGTWATTAFALDVELGGAGSATVILRGDLDQFSGPALRVALRELIASGRTRLTFDLSALDSMDSVGHSSIRSVADLAESRGGGILLSGCSPAVRHFLEVTTDILASSAVPGSRGGGHVDPSEVRPLRTVGY